MMFKMTLRSAINNALMMLNLRDISWNVRSGRPFDPVLDTRRLIEVRHLITSLEAAKRLIEIIL